MARHRRKTSPLEDIFEVATRLPWWVSGLLAGVFFVVLHFISGIKPTQPAGLGQMGSYAVNSMIRTLAYFGKFLLPLPLALASLFSLIKELKQKPILQGYDAQVRQVTVKAPNRTTYRPPDPPVLSRNDAEKDHSHEWESCYPPQPEKTHEWSAQVLNSLEWKRFETVCVEYFRMTGYDPKETRIGADGGVDIWVYKPGSEKPFGIVQCKAWTTYKVGIKSVRELFGVMAAEGVGRGMFITSGEFTSEALEFAAGKSLRLISGNMFLDFIGKLPVEKQQELLSLALEGDYRTPTCPRCGIKMTLREGKGSGRDFWGCLRFPRCKATLVYKAEAV